MTEEEHLEKISDAASEALRLLGKVVPDNQDTMIEWAVKSKDSVYTNAGAAYRVLREVFNSDES